MGTLINLPNISAEAVESLNFDEPVVSKKNSVFNEKNYLNVRLGENESSRELRIRLLPMDLKTGSPFVRTYFHSVKVPTEIAPSGWKSFLCLHRNTDIDHEKFGSECPFCELNKKAYEASLKETDEIIKKNYQKLSLDNLVKEAVIVRCIERGKEEEGVKFWKFNLSKRKDDPYHIIMDLYNSAKREGEMRNEAVNIFDLYKGVDLVINIRKNVDNNRDVRTTINITTARYESPITNDNALLESWIFDEKKWSDVFTPKPYEYLKLVSEGRIPWFDRAQNKWVDKNDFEKGKSISENNANNEIKTAEQQIINQSMGAFQQPPVYSEPNYGFSQGNSFIDELDADRGLPN